MQVGDVVIPVGDTVLACGCGCYDCAIVASVEPFALASVKADMLWTCTIRPGDVLALCQAAPEIVARAVKRYESHTSNSPIHVTTDIGVGSAGIRKPDTESTGRPQPRQGGWEGA